MEIPNKSQFSFYVSFHLSRTLKHTLNLCSILNLNYTIEVVQVQVAYRPFSPVRGDSKDVLSENYWMQASGAGVGKSVAVG